ncbi:hypothetical protein [Dysgonomonas sp. 216]|uniref:hypothetical protein n=1 Tax=Dysgonomonas sp. 216 TaxID=2302934 RepID=UPI0013D65F7A|nr:hypothetical protein [Dysgonomonas sp. 216]
MTQMKHIYDIGYKLLAIKTLFQRFQDIGQMPSFICYKKHSKHDDEEIYFDLNNTIDYEEEIRNLLSNKDQKESVSKTLKKHLILSQEICSLYKKIPSKDIQEEVVVYFTYSRSSISPLSDLIIVKQNKEKDQLLFYTPFVAERKKQLWNPGYYSDIYSLSKYIPADNVFEFRPFFRTDDLEQIFPNELIILPNRIIKIIEDLGAENLETSEKVNFDMGLISVIHKEWNDKLWKSIKEKLFYDVLHDPLRHTNTIQSKHGNTIKFYYLLYRLKNTLPDSLQKEWLTDILKSTNINPETYNKKYTAVKGISATSNDKKFVEKVEKIFLDWGFKI